MGISSKQPANLTPQIELLYRDIKIQLEELQQLRPYKAAIEELQKFLNSTYSTIELLEVEDIIKKYVKK